MGRNEIIEPNSFNFTMKWYIRQFAGTHIER